MKRKIIAAARKTDLDRTPELYKPDNCLLVKSFNKKPWMHSPSIGKICLDFHSSSAINFREYVQAFDPLCSYSTTPSKLTLPVSPLSQISALWSAVLSQPVPGWCMGPDCWALQGGLGKEMKRAARRQRALGAFRVSGVQKYRCYLSTWKWLPDRQAVFLFSWP